MVRSCWMVYAQSRPPAAHEVSSYEIRAVDTKTPLPFAGSRGSGDGYPCRWSHAAPLPRVEMALGDETQLGMCATARTEKKAGRTTKVEKISQNTKNAGDLLNRHMKPTFSTLHRTSCDARRFRGSSYFCIDIGNQLLLAPTYSSVLLRS